MEVSGDLLSLEDKLKSASEKKIRLELRKRFLHVVYVCVDMYVHECVCVFVYVVCMFVCGLYVYVHVCV